MPDPTPALSLRFGGVRAGEDRLRLLEAIDRLGSITAAGQAVGLSYRAAWDAVQSLNNLFPKPLVAARAGGRSGGAAELTPEGKAALATLRHVQAEIALTLERLERRLGEEAGTVLADPWRLVMRTSARNALRGVVSDVTHGAVDTEVTLKIHDDVSIVSIISKRSAEDLRLAPGMGVIALIKASFVILAQGDGPYRTSARNALPGTVTSVEEGAVNSEVAVELADGKTLTAIVTRHSAEALELKPGDRVTALVKAPHVILAVE
ncbi:MAG TPA: TOBE domain-containing protein [Caulobacteraceae bacterium]|jgi:molybdate transport system regulatory protein